MKEEIFNYGLVLRARAKFRCSCLKQNESPKVEDRFDDCRRVQFLKIFFAANREWNFHTS